MPQHFFDADLAKVLAIATGSVGFTLANLQVIANVIVLLLTAVYIVVKIRNAWRGKDTEDK